MILCDITWYQGGYGILNNPNRKLYYCVFNYGVCWNFQKVFELHAEVQKVVWSLRFLPTGFFIETCYYHFFISFCFKESI